MAGGSASARGAASSSVRRQHLGDRVFAGVALAVLLLALAGLAALLADIVADGAARLDWPFLTNVPSRRASGAGIYHALMGTIWVIGLT